MAIHYGSSDEYTVNEASASTSPQIPFVARTEQQAAVDEVEVDERLPLLSDGSPDTIRSGKGKGKGKAIVRDGDGKNKGKVKKPFYRARPLWLVPFALVASLVRGMTLAPRVEVFTQLSCHRVYGIHHHPTLDTPPPPRAFVNSTSPRTSLIHLTPHVPESSPILSLSIIDGGPIFSPSKPDDDDDTYDPNDDTSDPRSIPSQKCTSDPDVQAGAARLQMIMTTTMGLLSALTTGWWGHFGERHGRTRVLAGATFGLFLTDLVFILVSTPNSPLSKHGHILLIIAPIIEGALGGTSTLSATTNAYISDCTSSGSRAHIFSRFSGVTYLGIFLGPTISGYLIQRSNVTPGGEKNVTSVFWVAITCSFLNFLAAVFVFPESLDKEKRSKAKEEWENAKVKTRKGKSVANITNEDVEGGEMREEVMESVGVLTRLVSPLAVFLPAMVRDRNGSGRLVRDWSLTVLGVGYFCLMLCAGVYQLKYLYAEHVYGWGAEQLSWYISFLGGARATALLVLLPYLIGLFKPKPTENNKGKSRVGKGKNKGKSLSTVHAVAVDGKKPKPTRSQLGREISFDLTVIRCSLLMDIVSNLLIIASPAPSFHHSSIEVQGQKRSFGVGHSQALFVMASGMASFGTGAGPAIHSLTLCVLQAREMCDEDESEGPGPLSTAEETRSVGGLFGAFAFLQSIGSMILGPMIFGMIYSGTVGAVPKAIFMVAAGTLGVSIVLMMLVRNPVERGRKQKKRREAERGRSRASKDLRGGAAGL